MLADQHPRQRKAPGPAAASVLALLLSLSMLMLPHAQPSRGACGLPAPEAQRQQHSRGLAARRLLSNSSSASNTSSSSSSGAGALAPGTNHVAVCVLGVSSDLGACARAFSNQALQLVRGGDVHYTLMQGQEPHW